MANNENQFEYDVALSFAGEDRVIVRKIAELLIEKHINVFYDEQEVANLWGKELVPHLAEVYGKKARYCVMFISQYYPIKKWTNVERTHAQARAFRDTNEYILPVRLDATEVPGIAETIGYIDFHQHTVESIANLVEQKLNNSKRQANALSNIQDAKSAIVQSNNSLFGAIPMPTRKKSFTQLQKDRFAKESIDFVKKYFQQALKQLDDHDRDVQTDFVEINNTEFTCRIYVQEAVKCQCVIWLGDTLMPNTIYYNEGVQRSGHNSFNDYLPVEDNGEELRLRIGNFGIGMGPVEEPLATQQQAAEYLWKRFTSYLV